MHTHTHAHKRTQVHTESQTRTHTDTHKHTHSHTHSHTDTYSYTCKQTHKQRQWGTVGKVEYYENCNIFYAERNKEFLQAINMINTRIPDMVFVRIFYNSRFCRTRQQ